MSDPGIKRARPLSPHLQVYRPQMTSVMSILHRATGYALAVGTIMMVWMLLAAATGADAFTVFTDFCASALGQVMLFGWSVALFYHMSNGIRHLIWDTGYLFKLKNAYRAGYVVLGMTVVMTGLFWLCVCVWS